MCQLWKLWPSPTELDIATESTETEAWPKLGHAKMEASLQALKISQVAQEQDYIQINSEGGAQSLEVSSEHA